jgi:hypothetical protein
VLGLLIRIHMAARAAGEPPLAQWLGGGVHCSADGEGDVAQDSEGLARALFVAQDAAAVLQCVIETGALAAVAGAGEAVRQGLVGCLAGALPYEHLVAGLRLLVSTFPAGGAAGLLWLAAECTSNNKLWNVDTWGPGHPAALPLVVAALCDAAPSPSPSPSATGTAIPYIAESLAQCADQYTLPSAAAALVLPAAPPPYVGQLCARARPGHSAPGRVAHKHHSLPRAAGRSAGRSYWARWSWTTCLGQ